MHLPEPHTFISSKVIDSSARIRRQILVKLLLTIRSMEGVWEGGVIDNSRSKITIAVQSPMATHTNHYAYGTSLLRARSIQVKMMTGQPGEHERENHRLSYPAGL